MPEGFVKALEFRICLIHHHPLPVVTAEVLPGVAPSGFADKVRSLVTTLTGEHTNMFKNGGTFLLKSLDNRLDLVLHGHQQTLLVLEHPISGEVARRLLVAGAGSAALPVAESYRYCVYTLDVSGNIHVSERM